jgi:hypothetical protein
LKCSRIVEQNASQEDIADIRALKLKNKRGPESHRKNEKEIEAVNASQKCSPIILLDFLPGF